MTEAELQMMDTIHLRGMVYSMNDDELKRALECMAKILEDGQQERWLYG